ncbi:MAG: response regulator [Alphaproteobacteria bacterium]
MKKKVLIVEDNPLNMRLFSDLLKVADLDVIQVIDGMEALNRVIEHTPDLILMDIHLPGISGLDITRSIRQNEKVRHIPVIAVTAASANQNDEEAILGVGFNARILKPISVTDFLSKVKEFLQIS